MSNTMPIISIDSTFFWQIINFFILLFIVKKYFKEPIGKILAERKNKIEEDIIKAEKDKKEAENVLNQAEIKIENTKKEAIEIVKRAERKATEEAELILREAKESREKILKSTETEVKKMKENTKEELNEEVKILAADLAEKLIKEKIDSDQEMSLIDEFISKVGEEK